MFAARTGWTLAYAGRRVDTVAGAPGKGSDVPWVCRQKQQLLQEQQSYVGVTSGSIYTEEEGQTQLSLMLSSL